ncbi:MAG: class I SAM-dependent methyltransferase, partial [Congregibacter sp.]|nr:class I SAM-dependent methyltransferase [Congregibacter sp.]
MNLPYSDGYFDVIYYNQVLEHVRRPDELIAEVVRVLKPGGTFLGSVSYLEPFHSYSIFNRTSFGVLQKVLNDVGLTDVRLKAGVDASQLINRQLLNRTPWLQFIWRRSFYYGWVG